MLATSEVLRIGGTRRGERQRYGTFGASTICRDAPKTRGISPGLPATRTFETAEFGGRRNGTPPPPPRPLLLCSHTQNRRAEAGGGVASTLYGVAAPSIACARRDCVERFFRTASRVKTRARRCTDGGLAPADRPNLNRPRVPTGTLIRDCKETVWGGTTSVTSARPARPAPRRVRTGLTKNRPEPF